MITPLHAAPKDPTIVAARWLAAQPEPPVHVVPTLKERFDLTGLQACQAIALARQAPISRAGDVP